MKWANIVEIYQNFDFIFRVQWVKKNNIRIGVQSYDVICQISTIFQTFFKSSSFLFMMRCSFFALLSLECFYDALINSLL